MIKQKNNANAAQRFVLDADQGALGGGVMVRTYLNKFSMAGPKVLDIRVHPNMPAGAFLFQAEDGIRAGTVTGVQTCALPIYEQGSPWEPLSVERGFAAGASTVTLFAAGGVQGVADQLSRTPESLARSLA